MSNFIDPLSTVGLIGWKGYGYATLDPPVPVDPHTLFFTASTTKAQVAAAYSILIDESDDALSWNTSIASIIHDDFVLTDSWATEHITIEDAFSHRTGYPRHDRAYRISNSTTRDVVRLLRHLPMTAEPRMSFHYTNIMYATLGHVIETLTGSRLGDYLTRKLWHPLGMKETFFYLDQTLAHHEQSPANSHKRVPHSLASSGYRQRNDQSSSFPHLATPYRWIPDGSNSTGAPTSSGTSGNPTDSGPGHFSPEPYRQLDPISGAIATISSVHDYALLLRSMLQRSGPVSPTAHAQLRTPRIALPPQSSSAFTALHLPGVVMYCLGWVWTLYRGRESFGHPGSMPGFGTETLFLPGASHRGAGNQSDRGWAIAIMGNTEGTSNIVGSILANYLLEAHLQVPEDESYDIESTIREIVATDQAALALPNAKAALYPEIFVPAGSPGRDNKGKPPSDPPLPLHSYTGTYHHPGYGNMSISSRSEPAEHLHLAPSPCTWPYTYTLHHLSAGWFLAQLISPYPASEFAAYPQRYTYGDEGDVRAVARAVFDVGAGGGVEAMGLEIEESMVWNGEAGRRREGMVWFERLVG